MINHSFRNIHVHVFEIFLYISDNEFRNDKCFPGNFILSYDADKHYMLSIPIHLELMIYR